MPFLWVVLPIGLWLKWGRGRTLMASLSAAAWDGSKSAGKKIGWDVRAPEGMSEGSACVD